MNEQLTAVEIKAFVPASDFARSMDFYLALGFEIPWHDEELAYVRHGETSFLLQALDAHSAPGFAANYQMHLLVQDVDAWFAQVQASGVAQHFGVRLGEPENQPWRMRDFVLFDPSGVLWRIAQNID